MKFKIFTSLLFVLTACSSVFAYSPPIGIPDPANYWAGTIDPIDDPVPNPLTKCPNWPGGVTTGCYYIDVNHGSCTDSNIYGFPNSPRCSIPDNLTLTGAATGGYLEIHAGTYTNNNTYNITADGTTDYAVWIVGKGSPVLRSSSDNSALAISGSYIIIDGISFDRNEQGLTFDYPATHCCYRNSTVIGEGTLATNGSQIGIAGNNSSQHINHIVIYNITMYNIGDYTTASTADTHGIKIRNDADYIWILDSDIYKTQGDSVQTGEATLSGQDFPTFIFIGGNTFYENKENGIDVKSGSDMIFSGNLIYNHANDYGDDAGEGIVIHDDPPPDFIWNINNTLFNNGIGIISTQGTNIFMIGNVLYNHNDRPDGAGSCYGRGVAIHLRNSGASGAIVNNTLYNNDVGIQVAQGNAIDISNNIISGRTFIDAEDAWDLTVCDTTDQSASHNQFYSANGTVKIRWDNTYTSVTAFQSATAQCDNCKEGNPLLIAPPSNFSISESSPEKDQGETHSVFSTFSNRYSWTNNNIAMDCNGTSRPQDGFWDIGAYESAGRSHSMLLYIPAFLPRESNDP